MLRLAYKTKTTASDGKKGKALRLAHKTKTQKALIFIGRSFRFF